MIKDSFNALGASARDAFRGWRVLLLLAAVYALLLASPYVFFATGVNTRGVVLSALTALATPLLFFLFQAGAANAALPDSTFGRVARRAPRDMWELLLLALPLAALAVLFIYLLGKLEGWLPKVEEAQHVGYLAGVDTSRPVPLHWQEALLSWLWLLLLGLVLPLAAVHLWLSAARDGLVRTLKGVHRVVGRAFAPRPLLAYAAGLFVFGLMPYFVLFTRTSITNGWAELSLFGLRLAFVFALTLVGWVVTLGALARLMPPAEAHAPEPEPEPAA
jgi:hypothetical protein